MTNLSSSFGPNTFPANNSALFACEVHVDYAIRTLFRPIIDRTADVIEVRQSAENFETNKVHTKLRNSVFAAACSNWYIGEYGRNAASWPGTAASFWLKTLFLKWSAFQLEGGAKSWFANAALRSIRDNVAGIALVLMPAGVWTKLDGDSALTSFLSAVNISRCPSA